MRFPGFEGEWGNYRLGEIATFSKGKGIPKSDIDENGITECVRYGELYTYYGETIDNVRSKTNVNVDTLTLSEANDVIIPASGETMIDIATASCVLKSGVALGGDLNIIKTKNDGVFLSYYLNSKKKLEIANLAQGISVVHLYSSQLSSLSLMLPTLEEQKRISTFLASLDKRIQTQNKIIEGLKVQILGLQEQIFRRKIKLTYKNGDNFPEWELKTMKELFTFKITNSFSREQLNYENGLVKNIHYGDIHTKFHTLFDIQKEEVPYINTDVKIDRISEENYCAIGDMIFADASEDLIDVGKSIEIVNLNNQKLLAGLHTILARPINRSFEVGFCGYLFKSDGVKSQIQKESQGSKVLSISAVRLSKVSISIPCIDEQTKIVNFLSSIDAKINIENRLLDKLKEQKKFLLQQMFV